VLDDGVGHSGHFSRHSGQRLAFAIRIERSGAQVALIFIAKYVLSLMDGDQPGHPKRQPQPLVAALGQYLMAFALAGLALGGMHNARYPSSLPLAGPRPKLT
jgi:hypothetical protein